MSTTNHRLAFINPPTGLRTDFWAGLNLTPGSNAKQSWGGLAEWNVTENHPWRSRRTRRVRRGNIGGPFIVCKRITEIDPQHIDIWTGTGKLPRVGSNVFNYKGELIYNGSYGLPSFPTAVCPELNDSTLLAKGATAWAQCKPTASHGGLAQALGELHEIPRVPQLRSLRTAFENLGQAHGWRNLARMQAGEYLNVAFGWVPLLQDIRDLIRNIYAFDANLAQLERDNGRSVRRSKTLRGAESNVVTTLTGVGNHGYFVPALNSACYAGQRWTQTTTVSTKTDYKFTARFRYFIDFARARQGNLAAAAQLTRIMFGVELNPYVVWQLMPWSWLADWFSNTGDILNNLVHDSEDNLVADYAYINGKQVAITRYECMGSLQYGRDDQGSPAPIPVHVSETHTDVFFRRIAASPYGFGLDLPNFSARQIAILVALGINRWHN